MRYTQEDILNALDPTLLVAAISAIPAAKQQTISRIGTEIATDRQGNPILDKHGLTRLERIIEPVVDADDNPVMVRAGATDLTASNTAFNALEAMVLPEIRKGRPYTYNLLNTHLDIDATNDFKAAVDSAIAASDLPEWLGINLTTGGAAIGPRLESMFNSLVGRHGFTQPMLDAVFVIDKEIPKLFPRLKAGHVSNAIYRRAVGEI